MDDYGYHEGMAVFYDSHVGDRGDVDFYVERARAVDGPALELACGTGRVYLELLAAGVDADGIDASAATLDVLRENAADRGLDPSVRRADVADFEADREYSFAYCPFNALQHLRSIDQQLAAVECVHDALAPGGEFVFDAFVPSFDVVCETYGEWRTETVTYRGEPHEVRTRSRLVDELRQEFEVVTELHDADGDCVFETSHRLALLPFRHLELLARLSPFDEWSVAGSFDGDPVRTATTCRCGRYGRDARRTVRRSAPGFTGEDGLSRTLRKGCRGCEPTIHLDDRTTRVWEYRCPDCHTKIVDPA